MADCVEKWWKRVKGHTYAKDLRSLDIGNPPLRRCGFRMESVKGVAQAPACSGRGPSVRLSDISLDKLVFINKHITGRHS